MPINVHALLETSPSRMQLSICKISDLRQWEFTSLNAPFWRCYIPLTRGGYMRYRRARHDLVPGVGYIIPPHTDFAAHTERPFRKAYCNFTLEIPRVRFEPGVYTFSPRRDEVRALGALASAGRSLSTEVVLNAKMYSFAATGIGAMPAKAFNTVNWDRRIEAVRQSMEENLKTPMTNAQLAELAGLQENSFVRFFRTATGQSPQRFYRRLRLVRACELLTESDLSIEQIADRCGFWDRNHFTHAFRKLWHCPPAEFRRKSR